MSKTFHVSVALIIALAYIVFFNILFFISPSIQLNNLQDDQAGGDTNIGFGDSVNLEVRGERFFGLAEIKGSGAHDRSSILYVFGIIPIPYEFNGINFSILHYFFFGGGFILLLLFLIRPERRRYKDE